MLLKIYRRIFFEFTEYVISDINIIKNIKYVNTYL